MLNPKILKLCHLENVLVIYNRVFLGSQIVLPEFVYQIIWYMEVFCLLDAGLTSRPEPSNKSYTITYTAWGTQNLVSPQFIKLITEIELPNLEKLV